jgi:hypothetical protein
MHPDLIAVVASEREAEIRRAAERSRRLRGAVSPSEGAGRARGTFGLRRIAELVGGRYLRGGDAGHQQPLHRTGHRAHRA